MKSVIVVHGGAGTWDLDSDRYAEAIEACRRAAAAGQALLKGGGTALDAVEAAVRILEDCPAVDAGRGSYLNTAGQIEMDALIMDGATLNLGAVAAVQRVQNPISLARRVMSDCDHTFLVGSGAEAFAEAAGIPRCELADLVVESEWEAFLARQPQTAPESQEKATALGPLGDTVGAVALDGNGNLAAATSTGGTRDKMPGRVGDSPLPGSGGYADNWTAAVSATGHGEQLMKVLISKRVCDFVSQGLPAQKACEAAVHVLEERVNGVGGLIAVDMRGRIGIAHNTVAMPHAYAIGDETVVRSARFSGQAG
jgi:L-asparaginase / beta-aspartyl-peptidase